MNWKAWLAAVATTGLLAACGGGGSDAGTPPFGDGDGGGTSGVEQITLSLARSVVQSSQSEPVEMTATVVGKGGQTIADAAVTLEVNGGTYTMQSTKTDSNGQIRANIGLGADKTNRTISIKATSGGRSATAYLTVVGSRLTTVSASTVLAPSAAGSVTFRLEDAGSTPISGQAIEVSASNGASASGVTTTAGEFTYAFTAPASTGALTLTASSAGVVISHMILVQESSVAVGDAGVVTSKSMDINPTVVAANSAGSTANKSLVRVILKGDGNVPLKNVRVKFDLADDPHNVGGTFSVSEVYSDDNGVAATSYIPGTRSSPTDGVRIRACYASSGLPAAVTCGVDNVVSATMTVTADAVSVSIGTDEFVYTDTPQVYYRKFVVQVVDAAGMAKSGVTITPQLDLLQYAKGYFYGDNYESVERAACLNEDRNRNATLDPLDDVNNDNQLWPRKASVAVSWDTPGSNGRTDANGRIVLKVTYPRSDATWVQYALNVSGSVDGSEGRTSWTEWARYPASALTGEGAPAFVTSPYGTETEDATVGGTILTPCENPN